MGVPVVVLQDRLRSKVEGQEHGGRSKQWHVFGSVVTAFDA
jgi:hypothetical protein